MNYIIAIFGNTEWQKIYTHRSAAIFFGCLPFDKVALAFMLLAPSFEIIF
jgi:hypothetical protein